jgi:Cu/Ag efflux pump CusA
MKMSAEQRGPIAALIRFCLENKLIVLVAMTGLVLWGLMSAPFD